MAALRDTVRRELGAEPLARPGRPTNAEKGNNITVSSRGDTPSYAICQAHNIPFEVKERAK